MSGHMSNQISLFWRIVCCTDRKWNISFHASSCVWRTCTCWTVFFDILVLYIRTNRLQPLSPGPLLPCEPVASFSPASFPACQSTFWRVWSSCSDLKTSFPHMLHLYGFKPLWIRACLIKLCWCRNFCRTCRMRARPCPGIRLPTPYHGFQLLQFFHLETFFFDLQFIERCTPVLEIHEHGKSCLKLMKLFLRQSTHNSSNQQANRFIYNPSSVDVKFLYTKSTPN